jgi:hypothetical protein
MNSIIKFYAVIIGLPRHDIINNIGTGNNPVPISCFHFFNGFLTAKDFANNAISKQIPY